MSYCELSLRGAQIIFKIWSKFTSSPIRFFFEILSFKVEGKNLIARTRLRWKAMKVMKRIEENTTGVFCHVLLIRRLTETVPNKSHATVPLGAPVNDSAAYTSCSPGNHHHLFFYKNIFKNKHIK